MKTFFQEGEYSVHTQEKLRMNLNFGRQKAILTESVPENGIYSHTLINEMEFQSEHFCDSGT